MGLLRRYEIEIKMVDGQFFNVVREASSIDDLERSLMRGWFNAGNDIHKKFLNTNHIVSFEIKGYTDYMF